SAAPESESVNAGTADDGVPTIVIHRVDDDTPSPELEPKPVMTVPAQQTFVSGAAADPPPSEALQRALQKMREIFRIRELRPGQAEIIESVLAGQDTLAIM